jgi:AraC-like DNA-binding protein
MAAMLEKPARQRWSTADIESRHTLAYWVDTICKSFLEIDIESPRRHALRELIRMRLDCAHRLLGEARYSAVTVGEVALRSGFQEPSHFARRFRKAFGLGPMAFRASCRTS